MLTSEINKKKERQISVAVHKGKNPEQPWFNQLPLCGQKVTNKFRRENYGVHIAMTDDQITCHKCKKMMAEIEGRTYIPSYTGFISFYSAEKQLGVIIVNGPETPRVFFKNQLKDFEIPMIGNKTLCRFTADQKELGFVDTIEVLLYLSSDKKTFIKKQPDGTWGKDG